ncbi:MAG: ATP synthase subunit a [Candidatus Roizmanbacteria bacterium GW2011_GWA2_32_13]|uniref:ATP synthase subunit a n=1 Tax=Candidatus Roizmanbacteria bacterium GW2011_GWA2_32_13 TaxID=1618475 RepID=A0A0F9YYC1_9BACT|nr:MAG: ATP synthase subunit a [Candidatus Roizmanbacteria bacterium GW2011_GWA2_32_13]
MNISLKAETIFNIGSFSVTNTILMSWIASLIILIVLILVSKKLKDVPSKFQSLVEVIFEGAITMMDQITGSHEKSKKFFPFVFTFFIFILLSNWLGIVPGVGSIGISEFHNSEEVFIPLLRTANSDINITLAFAIISVIMTHIFGVITIGFFKHASKYISFKKGLIYFFVGILELIGELAKFLSFSFRLFGNIFAGEVLLVVIAFLIPYIAPIPFLGLELFVGLIQSLIFAMLTLVFFGMATNKEH